MHEKDALTWFEIPTRDLSRASRFYATLTGAPLTPEQWGEVAFHVFPYQPDGVSGCITGDPQQQPADRGTIVYLRVAAPLAAALARAESAGGRVAGPVMTLPGDMGVVAQILDTEGNRVGLHATV